jgi:hypothetical protein
MFDHAANTPLRVKRTASDRGNNDRDSDHERGSETLPDDTRPTPNEEEHRRDGEQNADRQQHEGALEQE